MAARSYRRTLTRASAVAALIVGSVAVGWAAARWGDDPESESELLVTESPAATSTAGPVTDEPPAAATSQVPAATDTAHADTAPATPPTSTTATPPAAPPGRFIETFDGAPDAPAPWNPSDWDVTVHSRDVDTWDQLEAMDAQHAGDCSSPGNDGHTVHTISSYADTVYLCRDHVMTALNASGYGVIYLTPNQLVDFSQGTAIISFDISTLRTAGRDWWDVWITPYDQNLQLPLEDWLPDLSGPPQNAVQIRLDADNTMFAEIFQDFASVQFPEFPNNHVPGDWTTPYDTFLTQDAARRDKVEIQISRTHLKVGMPAYDFWWVDSDIPELPFSTAVVQLGHHSYNPTKECGTTNAAGLDGDCRPNTWHWDNVLIDPAIPFTIVRAGQREASPAADAVTFASAAPDGAHLRFAAAGNDIEVSFDGGAWQPAEMQPVSKDYSEGTFVSYWTPIPAGTEQVRFRGAGWYGGDWRVRDVSIWSLADPAAG